MTSPVPPAAPEGVPVTLWLSPGERTMFDVPLDDKDEEYRALPVAAYDALLSRLAAAEGAREEAVNALRLVHKCGNGGARLSREASDAVRTALGAERGRG